MKRHSTVSAIRFQLASQSTDLQSGHSNMDNGKALAVPPSHHSSPSCCCSSTVWQRCHVAYLKGMLQGKPRPGNAHKLHFNACKLPVSSPTHPPLPVRLRSAAPGKFIALQWPSERRTNGRLDDGCVRAAIATLHFANGR